MSSRRRPRVALFTARMVSTRCLETVNESANIVAVFCSGPQLRPLPFTEDSSAFFADDLPVFEHRHVRKAAREGLFDDLDLIVSVGYGSILAKAVYSRPAFGAINLHPSLLPKHRGKHPDIMAVLNGESHVGVTLHYIDDGIDTGDIISSAETQIGANDDIVSLSERLYDLGADLLAGALYRVRETGQPPEGTPQPAPDHPLSRQVRWEDSAWRIHNTIRALTFPWPMAYARSGEVKLFLTKSRMEEDSEGGTPGQIIDVSDLGVTVATACGGIRILEGRTTSGEIVVGSSIAESLDVRIGAVVSES